MEKMNHSITSDGQTAILTITIDDVNDERPKINGLVSFLQIRAGQPTGNILSFTVTDPDTAGTLATTMTAQAPNDGLFSMAACSTSCTLALATSPNPDTMNADSYKVNSLQEKLQSIIVILEHYTIQRSLRHLNSTRVEVWR